MSAGTFRRTISVALAAASMFVGAAVATGVPAQAAAGYCTTAKVVKDAPVHSTRLPTTARESTNCIVTRGASGAAVRALQTTLRTCHQQFGLAIDGKFGPATDRALRNAQRSLKIKADGVYGPQTREALKWRWQFKNDLDAHRCATIKSTR